MAIQVIGYTLHSDKGQLELQWKEGPPTFHSYADLRRKCPCASCRTERDKMQAKSPKGTLSLRVISTPGPAIQKAEVLEVTPVGRYALAFQFNDGHKTGIFTYEFLYEMRITEPTPAS